MPQTRQLAAIMFTDIVGYTALMGDDERKAFSILTKNRQLQKPIIEKYNGRWIKELGDGILASFTTVSDAVYAAKEIQEQCKKSAEFSLRIGIHQGEIVVEDDDVFGDAVNVASRIQSIAPVSGIYVSERVQNDLANKADIQTRFVKTEKLKNVRDPLRIYEIVLNESDPLHRKNSTINTEKARLKSARVYMFLLAAVIAIAGLAFFLIKGRGVFAHSSITSIAVLPFVNESKIADMEYLSDGMAESLINSLSKLQEVTVKARSSVFRYKGKDIDPQKIGDELSVEAILNGSVAQRGDDIILNLELVDVRTGNQIWGEQYNRKTTDLLVLQRDIAHDVSNKLQSKLSGADEQRVTKSYTENFQAYQLYLQGRYHWNKRTKESLQRAVDYFNQALQHDANYALAYLGLADCYAVFDNYDVAPPNEAFTKSRIAAQKALEIDPTLGEAYATLGSVKLSYDWDFQGAERDYQKAISLVPNYATAHQWYAEFLRMMGRFNEAIASVSRAKELDPVSLIINKSIGTTLFFARRWDDAIVQYRKTLEIDPTFSPPYTELGWCYTMKEMYSEAIIEHQKAINLSKGGNFQLASLAYTYAKSGNEREARKILMHLKERSKSNYVDASYIASIHYGLRETDQAFSYLDKAYREKSTDLLYIKVDPAYDNTFRSDPRYRELVRKIGLP
jgi:TolB-like protein/class 3 adenylate cyclase/Tfp pilus assembly protein PilF